MSFCANQPAPGRYNHLIKKHPCFNGEAHARFGRIHLPVSPACNIRCRFCKRSLNKDENRPGVSSCLLTAQEALETVERALGLCTQITVAGIAGPGDTLATGHALAAFRLIHQRFPHLINCLSTNGLRLPDKAREAAEAGVRTITVTMNGADVDTVAKVCSCIVYRGQYLTGRSAAEKLLISQQVGIRRAVDLGIAVKVNTVLIPGVNDHQTGEVARLAAAAGAEFINVIPLIPQHEFAKYRAPDCQEMNAAREAAERHLPVFRHCRRCRADACGIPGAGIDFAEQLYGQREAATTFSHG
ncbi:radical SAM protein [Acetonema longum]|uniref:Radical SAM domain protein n=1 Tax=Acetonema longum DSM 6540 TaxID=1009370 RepID=F7NPZ3_9FIRM|nr:radical SAM protein [Acetonema longum]EGO61870.1 Radical SAM domain protein [Acetonema longum DSM 6540]